MFADAMHVADPPPSDAGRVAVMLVVPAPVPVIVNIPDDDPGRTLTVAGTMATDGLEEESATVVAVV